MCITPDQLVQINRAINDKNHLEQLNDVLLNDVEKSDSVICYWMLTTNKRDSLLRMEREKFLLAEEINRQLSISLKEQQKQSRCRIIGVGVGATLLGTLIGVLLK